MYISIIAYITNSKWTFSRDKIKHAHGTHQTTCMYMHVSVISVFYKIFHPDVQSFSDRESLQLCNYKRTIKYLYKTKDRKFLVGIQSSKIVQVHVWSHLYKIMQNTSKIKMKADIHKHRHTLPFFYTTVKWSHIVKINCPSYPMASL